MENVLAWTQVSGGGALPDLLPRSGAARTCDEKVDTFGSKAPE
jgi:hypothetical protein